ncbi:hypothetical protein UA08_02446 [Talaromyces atroroseus]|uniref:Uncharacterized protein n=1 Tax=Talaromyces atroroseus TaxID=1441469 RepID=A0A225AJP0_TALAT|nr:hypothetical protein UA08_02446 [Talaromyces atroroseus]OKL61722.1 hypothetical protein UA08_02446 [Talaromyces atroroseus]
MENGSRRAESHDAHWSRTLVSHRAMQNRRLQVSVRHHTHGIEGTEEADAGVKQSIIDEIGATNYVIHDYLSSDDEDHYDDDNDDEEEERLWNNVVSRRLTITRLLILSDLINLVRRQASEHALPRTDVFRIWETIAPGDPMTIVIDARAEFVHMVQDVLDFHFGEDGEEEER